MNKALHVPKECKTLSVLWAVFTYIMVFYIIFLCQVARAESKKEIFGDQDISDHLKSKYKDAVFNSRLQKTENGPSGFIEIYGDPDPEKTGVGATSKDRALDKAKTVILGAMEAFGISDQQELKDEATAVDEYGGTHIRFRRYISGLPLDGMSILAHFRSDESMSSVSADVVAAPTEAYQEGAKEKLKLKDIIAIIESDIKAANIQYITLRVLRSEKVALSVSPYVVWNVDVNLTGAIGRWIYKIDAGTGTIIGKRNALMVD